MKNYFSFRRISLLLCVTVSGLVFSGCSRTSSQSIDAKDGQKQIEMIQSSKSIPEDAKKAAIEDIQKRMKTD